MTGFGPNSAHCSRFHAHKSNANYNVHKTGGRTLDMATAQQPKPRAKYPQHEYADQHKAFKAREEFGGRRRLRDAAELQPSAEVACMRIRELAWDVGAEARAERPDGWMAGAARAIGLDEGYGRQLINGTLERVGTRTVDAVAKHTGVPVRILYDPEL